MVSAKADGNCIITARCGNQSATCYVTVKLDTGGGETPEDPTPTTYTITRNLSNVTSSNSTNSVNAGDSYYTLLTCPDGYEITSVKVTMNGVDITNSVYTSENS